MEISQFIIVSILIEAIWENCKMIWDGKKINANMIGVLILSVIICVLIGLDLFAFLGIELALPYFGSAFTGIILARGSNFVHDLLSRLGGK